jgi:hypothetical protein
VAAAPRDAVPDSHPARSRGDPAGASADVLQAAPSTPVPPLSLRFTPPTGAGAPGLASNRVDQRSLYQAWTTHRLVDMATSGLVHPPFGDRAPGSRSKSTSRFDNMASCRQVDMSSSPTVDMSLLQLRTSCPLRLGGHAPAMSSDSPAHRGGPPPVAGPVMMVPAGGADP